MARAARTARSERGEHDGRRTDAWRGKDRASAKIAAKGRGAGRAARGARGPSTVVRAFKLLVLVGAFLLIGFFVVLVVEGAASVISTVKIGGPGGNTIGQTMSELVDKITTRVLDRDVPRTADDPPARRTTATPRRAPQRAPAVDAQRAPLEATRPEDDARHVSGAPAPDPQVERARERLDDLLRRL